MNPTSATKRCLCGCDSAPAPWRRCPRNSTRSGYSRVLVLCSPGQEDTGELVASALGERSVGMRADAVMHVPADVAERARTEAVSLGADGCVAVGGGSAIGLGKAIALKHDLPIVAVPTTYAGSEMTPVWGLTTDGRKETGRDPKVLPRSVVYDPELTLSLPVGMSVTSGINAMAHAVEALYAPDATPIISLMAEEGVRALAAALPRHRCRQLRRRRPQSGAVRSMVVRCRPGRDDDVAAPQVVPCARRNPEPPALRHPQVVLPYALAFNEPYAPDAAAALSRALGVSESPANRLWHLSRELGAPHSLAELGMQESDIERIAEEVTSRSYGNPRPITYDSVRDLLSAAWAGQWPVADPSPSARGKDGKREPL